MTFSCNGSIGRARSPRILFLSKSDNMCPVRIRWWSSTRFGNGRCWCNLELVRNSSAEQSGRELHTMEWRYWITRVDGGLSCEDYTVRNSFCHFVRSSFHFARPTHTPPPHLFLTTYYTSQTTLCSEHTTIHPPPLQSCSIEEDKPGISTANSPRGVYCD